MGSNMWLVGCLECSCSDGYTNVIESFNASLRKYTSNKKVFPNDEAALKSIYLALLQIKPKWNKSRFNWGQIYNQLYIHFPERIQL